MTHELSIAFQTDKRAAAYVALAKLVNQYAFDAVSVYCDAPYHPSYGPLMLMAPYIERARLGPAAISPSRMHPIDIAAQAALLADVAQAGTYIGLARGAWLDDHSIHEVKPAVQAIQEAAEVVNRLLSSQSGYAGDVYHLAEHVKAPYPLPNERIPLLIGTWGKRLCAVAGEIADEVKVGGSANPHIVPVIQSYIAVGEEKAKRSLGTVGMVIGAVSVIDDDREQARATARRSVAMYLPVIAGLDPTLPVERELLDRIKQQVSRNDLEAAAALISDDLLERFAFAGNAADIIGHCERLFEAGAKRVEFGTPHGLQSAEGIRILGEQVLPALADWQQK